MGANFIIFGRKTHSGSPAIPTQAFRHSVINRSVTHQSFNHSTLNPSIIDKAPGGYYSVFEAKLNFVIGVIMVKRHVNKQQYISLLTTIFPDYFGCRSYF